MEGKQLLDQKIAHLTEVLQNPDPNQDSVFCLLHAIFQLSRGRGVVLQPETVQWLDKTATTFLSPELLNLLIKLCETSDFQQQSTAGPGGETLSAPSLQDSQHVDLPDHIVSQPPGSECKFRCILCQMKLRREKDVVSHVNGKHHLTKVNRVEKKQTSAFVLAQYASTFGAQYIVAQPPGSAFDFRCKLCKTKLLRETDIDSHLKGHKHSDNLKEKNMQVQSA